MAPTTTDHTGKKKRISRSTRAGIIFPVSRVHRVLKSVPTSTTRVTKGAAVYLASALEYLVAEVLELSGNAAHDYRKRRILPRHILLAIGNDDELSKLLKGCVIPEGGVVPFILPAVFSGVSTTNSSASSTTAKVVDDGKKKPAKPALKKGKGSFTVLGAPQSKAAALKGTSVTTLSERVLINGQKLTVVQGSIVNIDADAIVHPTNNSFYMGGDVGNAIAKAGGQQLRNAVAQLAKAGGLVKASDVVISDAPNLSANHLIHVFSPKWNAAAQDECMGELDKATLNILNLANKEGLTSVALPSISSGHAGFPKQTAAQTILAALSKFFRQTATTSLKQVFFVLYDPESVNVYTTELQRMVE